MEEKVYHSVSCRQLPYGDKQGEGLRTEQHHHAVLLLCQESRILIHIFFDYRTQTSTLEYTTLDNADMKCFSETWSVFAAQQHAGLGTTVRDIVQQVQAGNDGQGDKYDLLSNNCQHLSGNIQETDYWSRTLGTGVSGMMKTRDHWVTVKDYVRHALRDVRPLEAEGSLKALWDDYSGKMFLPESMGGKLAETSQHIKTCAKDMITNVAKASTLAATLSYTAARALLDVAASLRQDVMELAHMLPSLWQEVSELERLHGALELDLERGIDARVLSQIRDLRKRYDAVRTFMEALLEEASKKRRQAREQKEQAENARNVMIGMAVLSFAFLWCPAALAASRGGAAIVAAGEAAAAAATAEAAWCGTCTILASSAIANEAANMNDQSCEAAGMIVGHMEDHLKEVDRHLRDLERAQRGLS